MKISLDESMPIPGQETQGASIAGARRMRRTRICQASQADIQDALSRQIKRNRARRDLASSGASALFRDPLASRGANPSYTSG